MFKNSVRWLASSAANRSQADLQLLHAVLRFLPAPCVSRARSGMTYRFPNSMRPSVPETLLDDRRSIVGWFEAVVSENVTFTRSPHFTDGSLSLDAGFRSG